jgi:peptidoglycan/LPS O-acetylase OafA/YrhL
MSASVSVDPPRPISSVRLKELDGLRAFAILPVILHHCYPRDVSTAVEFIGDVGWMGVDLFFVLSGFLITGILLDTAGGERYFRDFYIRRTLRIFPLYYLFLILFSIAAMLGSAAEWLKLQNWGGIWWYFAYIGNFRVAWLNHDPPLFSLVPLWSLQVEEQFYLIYPLLVAVLSRSTLRRVLIVCVAAAPLIRSALIFFVAGSDEACNKLMPSRMDSLALGGLVALALRERDSWLRSESVRRWAPWVTVSALGVYAAAWLLGHETRQFQMFALSAGYTIVDLACVALLARLVLFPGGKLAEFLKWHPLVYTGQIAYGLYLLHSPAGWAARKGIQKLSGMEIKGNSWASIPITFGAAFLAAGLSWRYFEGPVLRLKARFTGRP